MFRQSPLADETFDSDVTIYDVDNPRKSFWTGRGGVSYYSSTTKDNAGRPSSDGGRYYLLLPEVVEHVRSGMRVKVDGGKGDGNWYVDTEVISRSGMSRFRLSGEQK